MNRNHSIQRGYFSPISRFDLVPMTDLAKSYPKFKDFPAKLSQLPDR
ncbi:hypothetical protein HMPREF9103_00672 [Lentilactobacillus parafarraginis F0439]|uniref:Uncharacterized protein n=1 Tax=Lentilactobacillus parafarraginis F0439 TaxID=797515 RepID=G9ZLS4_9LACO|nr:hypothetical protein HMPREF9103_00672 [Lentilactobacillus parafarraginis F0439]